MRCVKDYLIWRNSTGLKFRRSFMTTLDISGWSFFVCASSSFEGRMLYFIPCVCTFLTILYGGVGSY